LIYEWFSVRQQLLKLRSAPFCPAVPQRRIVFREALRNNPSALRLMIVCQNNIVQSQHQGRNLKLIAAWSRQALQAARQIVAKQTRHASLKRRQVGQRGRGISLQTLLDSIPDGSVIGFGGQHFERIGSDERIAPHVGIIHRAVKKNAMRQMCQPAKCSGRFGRKVQWRDQAGPIVRGRQSAIQG
jgi:hypothetical protein